MVFLAGKPRRDMGVLRLPCCSALSQGHLGWAAAPQRGPHLGWPRCSCPDSGLLWQTGHTSPPASGPLSNVTWPFQWPSALLYGSYSGCHAFYLQGLVIWQWHPLKHSSLFTKSFREGHGTETLFPPACRGHGRWACGSLGHYTPSPQGSAGSSGRYEDHHSWLVTAPCSTT